MERLRGAAGCLKWVTGCFSVIVIAFMIVDGWAWLSGHKDAALILFYGASILVTVLAASAWSALLIRTGAEIGVRSQESGDRWDIAQFKVMIEAIRAARQRGQQPALLMPQQQSCWPPLEGITEGEFEEVERGNDGP